MSDAETFAQIKQINEWRRDPDIRELVRKVLDLEEVGTVSALAAENPEKFEALYETCEQFASPHLEVSNPDAWL